MPEAGRRLTAIMFTDLVGYTALMGADEARALQIVERSRELIRGCVGEHAGRCLEYEGDGTLSTFGSAVEAVTCAAEIQSAALAEDLRIRIGLHVGDVIESGDRIVGDGVNVASRVCGLAEAGDIYVSETVYDQVRNQAGIEATRIGTPKMKNVNRSIVVWALRSAAEGGDIEVRESVARSWGRKLRTLGAVIVVAMLVMVGVFALKPDLIYALVAKAVLRIPGAMAPIVDRDIGFVRSADGTRIAYASVGTGPPVVQAQVWSTHLEYGPIGPPGRLSSFLQHHRMIYYDGRGFGLSERGVEHSAAKRVEDLEAVIDAAGLDRFALWGFSAGTKTAMAYAARHPERVSHLILYGTILRKPLDDETFAATSSLISKHWGTHEPAYRNYFVSLIAPDATDLQLGMFNELMSMWGTAEDAAGLWNGLGDDASEIARRIRVPTLVMHRRDDVLVPFQLGLDTAGLIPDARFVAFEGKNHAFLPGEAEGDRAIDVIEEFIASPAS